LHVNTRLFLPLQGALLAALLLTACPLADDSYTGSWNNNVDYESRVFNVQRADNDRWYTLNALKLAEGTRSIVYVSSTELELVSPGLARYIAAEYDDRIYKTISGVFGNYLGGDFDVDNNGKTILLLLDIQDGYSGSGGYVAGYFDAVHMYDTAVYAKSNRADMLFIDIRPQSPWSMGFYVTLALELQHLINYAAHDGRPQETWLNEGLSCAAEYLYGGQQWSRITYYSDDPLGTIAQGNNFFIWNGYWEEVRGDTLANYATAYLFFQWLRIQGSGSGIYGAIARSEFGDYRAVTGAARGRINGSAAANTDSKFWDWLLSSWMIANYRNDPSPSLYGYHEEGGLNWTSHTISSSSSTATLYPGEGVVSTKQGTVTFSPGGHINYAGISTKLNLSPENVRTNPAEAGAVLSYNGNTDIEGSIETAAVYPARNKESGVLGSRSVFSPEDAGLPQSYPIGVHDLRSRWPEPSGSPAR
jgi:hypothetical protein